MKYTKEFLNNTQNSCVAYINCKEKYDKIKKLCPKMIAWKDGYSYYLLPREGLSKDTQGYEFAGSGYLIVQPNEIIDLSFYEIY